MAVFSQSNGIDDNATMFACKLQQRKKEKRNNAHAHAHAMAAPPFRIKGRSLLNFSHTPSFLSLSVFLIFMHVCSYLQTHLVLPPFFSLPRSLYLSICLARAMPTSSLSSLSQNSISHIFFTIPTGLSALLHPIHSASLNHYVLSCSSSYSCLPACTSSS